MTPLEKKVKSFFEAQGAEACSIPTESKAKKRTPDLLVKFRDLELIVEIKAIEENPSELLTLKAVESNEVLDQVSSDDVTRIAAKIRDANKQLRQKCHGRPGMVVISDERSFFTRALNPQQLLAEAMFGRETIWIGVPHPATHAHSQTIAHDFGLSRTVSPGANTTTSAVALLLQSTDGTSRLLIHHNPHASSPLQPGTFKGPNIVEFLIPSTTRFSGFYEINESNGT
jgi:hypothetical protein